ncbi:restriction endonuclease subunit S [Bacillus paranthracis]|uniref:restriction endonuclease subunit S n=1 Tax=Bacillus paranthracis TaxID=2026186 RepID=UPI002813061D|nr:restriction endonuclease subunit S [Bacillus paranthracis]MDR0170881.1 restriction endonuclease subunit S [Bacillus paranthracis]
MSKVQAGYKSTRLRDIPEGWEIVSLADVADPNKPYALTGGPFGSDLKSEEYTESGVRIIQLQNIKEGYFSNGYKIYTSEEKANQLFNCNIFPNDIIIAKMAEPVARACIIPNLHERYLMASDGIRLAVNKQDYSTKYVMYAVNSSYFRKQAIDNSTGTTRLRIGLKTLKGLKLLKPSKEEQQKIATILSVVDKGIEKTEAVIEQTEKVKKGLIQQLLTKGIGHTKLKKAEFGEIPEDWEVKKVEECCENVFVGIASSTTSSYVSSGVPLIRSQNIKENYLDLQELLFISQEFSEKNKSKKLRKNDVITVRTGVHLGYTCVVPEELEDAHTFTTLITRPKREIINSFYLSLYINSEFGKKIILGLKAGGAQPNLNASVLKKALIPIPSISEQKRIVEILDSINNKIVNEKIKLQNLRALQKGLMQSLLTGKVRVKADETEVTQV